MAEGLAAEVLADAAERPAQVDLDRAADAAQGVGAVGKRRLTPLAIARRGERDGRVDLGGTQPVRYEQ